jgi:RNA polymerase sigma-70 factor (ECF subfamily)
MKKINDPFESEFIPTRKTLIQRLQNGGSQRSWQEFFDIYWRFIYSIARKSELTPEEAQDVVQETMLTVTKCMPKFQYDPAIGEFKAWLVTVTRSRIIDQVRKRGRLVLASPIGPDTTKAADVVDRATQQFDKLWDAEWIQNLLEAAKARVRRRAEPQQYQLYDYYVSKEWPPQKVADHFGVTVDRVYMAKHRIGAMIAEEVKRLESKML